MSQIAIQTDRLGKRYAIGGAVQPSATLRDTIAGGLSTLRRALRGQAAANGNGRARNEIWALKDVSFEVQHGEVLGVVGRNGAGKSTLLKVLSRITEPTEGRARIHGRVASLLEVGVGFHPELSGRENIFVNGAILGMRRAEIVRAFDEIVAFAEVEKFIDTPIKFYSSGMHVRLAFAVAAHLHPEILLVDEVLAVGDAGFQKKCLGKMREVGQAGRTVLFVSHNLAAVSSLCHRAVLVDGGRLVAEGTTSEVIARHIASFAGDDNGLSAIESRTDRYGDGRLRVTHVWIADAEGRPAPSLRSGGEGQIVLRYRCTAPERLRNVMVNLYFSNQWGERICEMETDFVGENFDEIASRGEFVCRLPRVPLQAGRYPLTFRVYSSERLEMDEVQNAVEIAVDQGDFHGLGRMPHLGMFLIDHGWQYRPLP